MKIIVPGLVSIVVLSVDRLDFLRRCVESVEAHTRTPYEWVFVLNGPTPDVRAYVDTLPMQPPCRGHWMGVSATNEGVTPGRNHGMRLAQGEFILFLDDDAWVTEDNGFLQPGDLPLDWLGRLTKYFDDPLVGVVGQSGSYIHTGQPGNFWACKTPGAECDVAQGYCFMFRASLIDQIGYLDPAYGKFWHEESDYALAAKAAGYKVINTGYVGVTHHGAGSGDDGTYGMKIGYMFRKWKPHFDRILVPRGQWR